MPTRKFPVEDLTQLLFCNANYTNAETGVSYKLIESNNTGETASETEYFGEWHTFIFEVDNVSYQCWYVDGNRHWRSTSGENWDEPFPARTQYYKSHERERLLRDKGDDTISCTRVVLTSTTTYEWMPV